MNRHTSKIASVIRLASTPRTKKCDMDVCLATSSHHLQSLLDLTHHCDIVEKETKTGLAYQQSSYSPRYGWAWLERLAPAPARRSREAGMAGGAGRAASRAPT